MDPSAHSQQQRDDWAASPIPPLWSHDSTVKRGVPSVDPGAHSRVRALPQTRCFAGDNQEHERIGGSVCENEDQLDVDGDNQEDDMCTELKALPPFSLVAPEPRRVVSPELIFSSAAERYTFQNSHGSV